MSWAIRLAPTGLWPSVEPTSHPGASANARGSALVLRGHAPMLGASHLFGGATQSARGAAFGLASGLRCACIPEAIPRGRGVASGRGTCPAGIRIARGGRGTCPAGPISRFVQSPRCPLVSMHAHCRSLSRGVAPGLMASPNTDTGALTRAGCGVPQCRLFVKGKGFAPVLTRSLRAATCARSLDK